MKKVVLFAAVAFALAMSSCSVVKSNRYTATLVPVAATITSENVVDLEVAPTRTTYLFNTTKEDRLGGRDICLAGAVQGFLKANGGADVIVAPEYRYDSELKFVEVTGHAAKYKNFRSVNK